MASKHFEGHRRSQTHDALRLMTAMVHLVQMEYRTCSAGEPEILLRITLPAGQKLDLSADEAI